MRHLLLACIFSLSTVSLFAVTPSEVETLANRLCQQGMSLREDVASGDMDSDAIDGDRSLNTNLARQYLEIERAVNDNLEATGSITIPLRRLKRCYQEFFDARRDWDKAAQSYLDGLNPQAVGREDH